MCGDRRGQGGALHWRLFFQGLAAKMPTEWA
jgi:hypothetical protein